MTGMTRKARTCAGVCIHTSRNLSWRLHRIASKTLSDDQRVSATRSFCSETNHSSSLFLHRDLEMDIYMSKKHHYIDSGVCSRPLLLPAGKLGKIVRYQVCTCNASICMLLSCCLFVVVLLSRESQPPDAHRSALGATFFCVACRSTAVRSAYFVCVLCGC